VARIAYLWNPENSATADILEDLRKAVPLFHMTLVSLAARTTVDFDRVSFPKIISARSDDAVHPRRAQQRRYQTVGLLDAAAHPCAVIGACAIHYSRWRTCSEFASGA
jgi:hypothetical protein